MKKEKKMPKVKCLEFMKTMSDKCVDMEKIFSLLKTKENRLELREHLKRQGFFEIMFSNDYSREYWYDVFSFDENSFDKRFTPHLADSLAFKIDLFKLFCVASNTFPT